MLPGQLMGWVGDGGKDCEGGEQLDFHPVRCCSTAVPFRPLLPAWARIDSRPCSQINPSHHSEPMWGGACGRLWHV